MGRYLDDLEAHAQRNHQVTALEVLPGIQAIRRLRAELGPERTDEMETDFTTKMGRLSAQLAGRDPN